ncbi:synaptotagmin-4 [Rhinichthys klamathensis goyatoka]|uniref:synaptotagmin-4 n=1 Tax=Rhinichthys klamathensis goyatoka TaxID=3034132 RepID=UPI0024B56166|nr:synaptotagmin-4 [Rhinichthys klamathensis goyatoka]XP_056124662.1 synaptotagmin-4 [Rhinichthys klamathensis goyatoka]
MAPVTTEEEDFAEVPVSVAVVSVFGLVFSVSIFAWICCQRKANKTNNKTPPYKFVHMLKGVDIYPESLNGKKKFGGEKTPEAHGKQTLSPNGGRPELHLDLENRDLNGNFTSKPPTLQLKVRSSPDLDIPSLGPCGNQDAGTPESILSSQTPTPAVEKSQDKDGGLGTLFFSVEYNFEKKAFMVHIKEAHGLSPTDEQSLTSDPYIKLTLLPEKKHKVKTRVLRKTLDPAFDETFSFYGIPYARVSQLALHFMVLSFDRFSRDEVIGETLVPLADIDLSEGRVLMSRDVIKRNVRRNAGRGELLLSLCYQSTTSTLTVVVLKARHLPKADSSGPSDPYVKVNLFQGKKRVCKKKTHVKKCAPNPVFNELFVFDLPSEDGLRDTSVELLLLDSDRTSRTPVIGRLLLGTSSPGTAGEHWREICDHPRRQIAKWHALSED